MFQERRADSDSVGESVAKKSKWQEMQETTIVYRNYRRKKKQTINVRKADSSWRK